MISCFTYTQLHGMYYGERKKRTLKPTSYIFTYYIYNLRVRKLPKVNMKNQHYKDNFRTSASGHDGLARLDKPWVANIIR